MLAELPADLFSHHASPLEFYIFVAVDERGEDVMPDDIYLSSMQRKTAKKEAWRPKCAAPRLVCDSALFFETFMHVYVRRTYNTLVSYSMSPPKNNKIYLQLN